MNVDFGAAPVPNIAGQRADISAEEGFSEALQTSDNAALRRVSESRLDMAEWSIAQYRGLVLLNDYCVCSVPKAINAATSEVRANSVGFSKGSRLHFTCSCMQVRSKWRFLGGKKRGGEALHGQGYGA